MPEETKDLIDVGETEGAEINLDDKGEAVKQEEVKEEIEVEQVPEDKTYENEKQVKLDEKKPEEKDELKDCLLYTSPSPRDGLLSRMPSSA